MSIILQTYAELRVFRGDQPSDCGNHEELQNRLESLQPALPNYGA
jgi:hypothetical protein